MLHKKEIKPIEEKLIQEILVSALSGEYDKIVDACDTVLSTDPHSVAAWAFRALTLAQQNKYDEALASYDKLLAIDPRNAVGWTDRAGTLLQLEKFREAVESCDKALAIDPRNGEAWSHRGVILCGLGRYSEGLESCDTAVRIEPLNTNLWIVRAAVLEAVGQRRKAEQSRRKARSVQADRSFAVQIIKTFKDAKTSYTKALAAPIQNPQAWVAIGYSLSKEEMYKEAIASYDKALAIDPKNATTWAFRGQAIGGLGRYEEAVESYDKALAINPGFTDAWTAKNEILDRLEEWLKQRRPPPPCVEVYALLAPTEERLHLFIRQRLQQALGEGETEWWFKSIDPKIRKKCAQRREDDPRRQEVYGYTDLIDLKEILDKNWPLFEADFQRAKGRFKSKKEFLDSLVRLNEIRKSVMHPVRGAPTEEDKDFARKMWEVIQNFSNLG